MRRPRMTTSNRSQLLLARVTVFSLFARTPTCTFSLTLTLLYTRLPSSALIL